MKTTTLILLFAVGTMLRSFGQKDDTTYYKRPAVVVSYLKPITIVGGRYYYGNQRLNGAYSLEIPIGELDDPEVSHRFNKFRGFQKAMGCINLIPTAYFFYSISGKVYNRDEYFAVLIGSFAATITLDIISRSHLKKAIEGYNVRLAGNQIGFSVQPLPNQTLAYGLGWRYRF